MSVMKQAQELPPHASISASVEHLSFSANVENYNELPVYPERPSFKDFQNSLQLASQVVVFDGCPNDPYHPSSTPIYQTSTFVQPSASEFGAYDYTRSGNPTRTALEKHIALLEKAHAAFAFTTGMAALMAATRCLQAGDELLIGSDVYGGMHRLVMNSTRLHGVKITVVNTVDLAELEAAITPQTKMLHMESPSNPLMEITDIRAVADLVHKHGVLLSVDSTMMTPLLQKPIELGADIVVHSLTKFFSGHADVMGGAVIVNSEELAKKIAFYQNAEGTALAPFDCWLFLRGIKTMHIRIQEAQKNAMMIADFLQNHPAVTNVYYAGLKPSRTADSRQKYFYSTHQKQTLGGGCVMSFTTDDVELSRRFIDFLRIFKLTVSFGSVNSLAEMPCVMSHASIPAEERKIPEDLIRLSVGIEDINDLTSDLADAFSLAMGLPESEYTGKFDSKFEDLTRAPVLPKNVKQEVQHVEPQRRKNKRTTTKEKNGEFKYHALFITACLAAFFIASRKN